ncbi:hypothetical protein O9G_002865 [Rozella allomycis CSF55]|uniref:Uncharacterized protein n=1 Tax=Rozella allomycis (strain CSF55) TaxID=988480 RepID=A0A075AWZ3_ROZAC|nr:hypothetical protein O9G_002865 [Rozella allomycis CSF55]|eukprot:EPZ33064.1 hypothetical protein O9G_002865 [Rozella allomycis CSF55]
MGHIYGSPYADCSFPYLYEFDAIKSFEIYLAKCVPKLGPDSYDEFARDAYFIKLQGYMRNVIYDFNVSLIRGIDEIGKSFTNLNEPICFSELDEALFQFNKCINSIQDFSILAIWLFAIRKQPDFTHEDSFLGKAEHIVGRAALLLADSMEANELDLIKFKTSQPQLLPYNDCFSYYLKSDESIAKFAVKAYLYNCLEPSIFKSGDVDDGLVHSVFTFLYEVHFVGYDGKHVQNLLGYISNAFPNTKVKDFKSISGLPLCSENLTDLKIFKECVDAIDNIEFLEYWIRGMHIFSQTFPDMIKKGTKLHAINMLIGQSLHFKRTLRHDDYMRNSRLERNQLLTIENNFDTNQEPYHNSPRSDILIMITCSVLTLCFAFIVYRTSKKSQHLSSPPIAVNSNPQIQLQQDYELPKYEKPPSYDYHQ